MKNSDALFATSTTYENVRGHSCPLCHGELRRTRRRPVDRFTGYFVPVRRFRCCEFSCQWEGNFPVQMVLNPGKPTSANIPTYIAVGSAVSAVLVVILIGSQRQYGPAQVSVGTVEDKQSASFKITPSDPRSTTLIELPIGPRNAPVAEAR